MKNKLTIILPVYHEEENIQEVIAQIQKHVKTPHSVMVVYDLKDDPTLAKIKEMKLQKSIVLQKNIYGRGIVNALKTGIQKAKSEIVVIMMADLSDDPKDIDKMVKKIDQGYDIVCASRYSQKGKRIGGPVFKGFLSRISCLSLAFFTGIPTKDATNAFKLFRRDIFKNIKIESVGGFEFPLEVTVKAFVQGKKITEIPTVWKERESGNSKFKLLHWFPQYLRWYFFAISNSKLKKQDSIVAGNIKNS